MSLAELTDHELEIILKQEYLKDPSLTKKERDVLEYTLLKYNNKRPLIHSTAVYLGYKEHEISKILNGIYRSGRFEEIQDNARIRLVEQHEADIKKIALLCQEGP